MFHSFLEPSEGRFRAARAHPALSPETTGRAQKVQLFLPSPCPSPDRGRGWGSGWGWGEAETGRPRPAFDRCSPTPLDGAAPAWHREAATVSLPDPHVRYRRATFPV